MVALGWREWCRQTTPINALLGIVDLDQGRVEIDGLDAAKLSPGRRLGHFGLLTQEFGRYNVTIRDIVRLGTPEPVSDERIWAALEAAHIGGLVHGLPDGLDTQLGPQFEGSTRRSCRPASTTTGLPLCVAEDVARTARRSSYRTKDGNAGRASSRPPTSQAEGQGVSRRTPRPSA
jgi:hypothetical protein